MTIQATTTLTRADWRWRSPKFLRQTFVEWSAKPINHSFWARAYYQQKRTQGHIKRRYGRSRSSGSGSCFGVGKIDALMMKRSIFVRSRSAVHRCSKTWLLNLNQNNTALADRLRVCGIESS